jgi:uracil-DNA glycosylase
MMQNYSDAVAAFTSCHRNSDWAALSFFKGGDAAMLAATLDTRVKEGRHVLPPPSDMLNALVWTSLEATRVVILGQDPYPTPGVAHGLAFSVNPEVKIPRSLRNIFKEYETDTGLPMPSHGYLRHWADQGVLLLNTCLTVEAYAAGSHRRLGWEVLTDQIIQAVSDRTDAAVFLLWGADAQSKSVLIDGSRHLILKAPHPSPLSARRGFFNSRPFSATNAWLTAHGYRPVAWQLSV